MTPDIATLPDPYGSLEAQASRCARCMSEWVETIPLIVPFA